MQISINMINKTRELRNFKMFSEEKKKKRRILFYKYLKMYMYVYVCVRICTTTRYLPLICPIVHRHLHRSSRLNRLNDFSLIRYVLLLSKV